MYEVSHNGRTSCEKLFLLSYVTRGTVLYDAERDLLAMAKFLVFFTHEHMMAY